MKETRTANIMFNKNGHGATTNRVTLPVSWVKELGFTAEDRCAEIKIDENKIIIIKG